MYDLLLFKKKTLKELENNEVKGDNSHGWLGPDPVPWVPASQVSDGLG